MPRIGARIVAFRRSSSARSAAALACATWARASVTFAWLIASCDCAARLRFSATSTALCASSSEERRSGLARRALAPARRCGAQIRRRALRPRPMFFCSCASAPSSEARAAWRLASAPRTDAVRSSLSSSTSTSPSRTTLSTSTCSAWMMPLAFDLISTLVIGSILPVATTERTIVPRSTLASRDGSRSGAAPLRDARPTAPAAASSADRRGKT